MRLAVPGLIILIGVCATSAVAARANQSPLKPPGISDARIELAKRYTKVTHREEILRREYEEQLQLSTGFCRNKPCQADLDKAIEDAARSSAQLGANSLAGLYAQRLSESQLRAAIRFYESPDGQAIVRATDQMSDDVGRIGHAMAASARQEISQHFCPTHAQICVSRSVQTMPSRP